MMTRILTFLGFVVAAAAGYVLGRRGLDVRVAVDRALQREADSSTTEIALRVTRTPGYDTEYDHVAEREHAERHRIAEEIKGRPLHERPARARRESDEEPLPATASNPLARERDDMIAPRPY